MKVVRRHNSRRTSSPAPPSATLLAGYNALSIPVERRVARYLQFDHLYAVGGNDGTRALSSVECYDPATNVWSVVASMTTAREGPGVAIPGGFFYAVGGWDGKRTLPSVERYDPATNVWSVVAAMTTARDGPGVAGAFFTPSGVMTAHVPSHPLSAMNPPPTCGRSSRR